MLSTLSMLVTALLASLAAAAANNAGLDFEISNLSITKVLGANVTLTFTIHDPDPVGEATQDCSGTWVTGSKGYPLAGPYEFCGNSTFAWRMESFTSIADFVLGMEHSYEDPSIGEPPYDYVDNFAKANITTTNHPCRTLKGVKTCAQAAGSVIKAPVYASIA